MSPTSECHDSGLLLVSARPRSSTYTSEFHEWYNSEHGPARMKLDFVKNGCQYKTKDDTPTWVAMYDLDRVSATAESQYNNLLRHRSLREQHLVRNKVDSLESKVFKHISTRGTCSGPAPVVTCVSFVVDQKDVEEVNRWYEEQHIEDLSQIPGWRRSRRFQLVDGESSLCHLLAIHDFDESGKNGLGGPIHMKARHRPWREKIVQLARTRVNMELNLCHVFHAEDYVAPPDTTLSAYAIMPPQMFGRRSSLASVHEQLVEGALVDLEFNSALLSQVH